MSEQAHERIQRKRIEAARRYAQAERSDPFAFARVMTHINNGLATGGAKDDRPHYDADLYYEERSYVYEGETVKYTVPAYKNVSRP